MNNTKINKIFDNNTIPIVFATDENFIPYLFVAIQSLVDNSKTENNYDIIILYENVNDYKKNQFKQLEKDNISIRFIDMSQVMKQYKDIWYTHWDYSNAVYYRFFIPQLFENYDKILHLDGDIIINCDIGELYNIDLEGKSIAACVGLARQHKEDPFAPYFDNVLKFPKEKYFNAGIMVFDIKKINETDFLKNCLKTLNKLNKPLFQDQDVLNIIFQDDVKYLDYTWNFTWNIIHGYKNYEINTPDNVANGIDKALQNIKILHFAGKFKPWKQPELIYADLFWKYARKTPFYEELIYKNTINTLNKSSIYNVIYRKKIYLQYLKCKVLRYFSNEKRKKHYEEKIIKLKRKIVDYRELLHK